MTPRKTEGMQRRLGLAPAAWTTAGVIVVAALLEMAPRLGWVDAYSLVPLSEMVRRAADLLIEPAFWHEDLLPSLIGIAMSFILAVTGGILSGLTLWRFPSARRVVDPWLTTYYAIPTFALYPLLVVVLGVGTVPIVLLGTLFAIVAMISATMDGLDATPRSVLRLAEALELSGVQRTVKVLLPAALPQISVGVRLALSYSLIGVLASEFVLSTRGLGHFISDAYSDFAIADMYAGVLIVFVLALTVNIGLGSLIGRRSRRMAS